MVKNALEIKNLVEKFGDFTAVRDISFNVKEGEIFGLLGPNGAGKSTTLNLILTLLTPTSGSINLYGIDIHKEVHRAKKMIGFMTQETVVEQDLTPRQNLEIFGELYHIENIKDKIAESLKDAELTDFADYKAGSMSGGMQRRLALVRSMIQDPKIIILDEPTTGLDVQNRTALWEKIRSLNKKGITVLLTTQYLEEADALCDRIAIIDKGEIKAIGTASELKASVSSGDIVEIVTQSDATGKVASVLEDFGLSPVVKIDIVTAAIEKGEIAKFSDITKELIKENIPILGISMHLPTLDDVFIKLTGTGLRDKAEGKPQIQMRSKK
ncbi:ABC transporter ATP-binding protein [Candidatus Mancarchaeum acidiphilum]|nr:ATP-binding cassette domain-containing protein [Candidatus Mancarchaeum acidiphilum]